MRDIGENRRQALDMMLTSRQTAAINRANASDPGPGAYPSGPAGYGGGGGGFPAVSPPVPKSNPRHSNAARTSYNNFRNRAITGRVRGQGGRMPAAY